MIGRPTRSAGVWMVAGLMVVLSCFAPLTVAVPLAQAQGESPNMTEEAGEEAAGEGSGNEGSGEDSGNSGTDVPPEAQEEVDEASRGDPAAQESVGSNANEEEQQPTAPDGTPLPEDAADAVEEGSRGDAPAQGSVSGDSAEPNTGGEDSGGEDATTGGEESGGALGKLGQTVFIGLLNWIWDKTFGWFVEQARNVGDAFLHLPDPTEAPEIVQTYEQARDTMLPLIAVVILAAAGAMTLTAYNKGLSHAGQTVAPRILGVTITLAVLPFMFSTLSTLSTDLTAMVLPDRGAIWEAQKELMKATLGNLAVTNILNVILMILGSVVVFLVIVTAFLKNIFYSFLFVASVFALIGGLVPQLWNFAVTWFKAVMVCAVISPLWALEMWIGSQFIQTPQMILGQSRNDLGFLTDSMLTTTIAIIIMWMMYKTPFKVLSWAFVSYDGSQGVGLRSFGRFMMFQAAAAGLKQVAGAAAAAKGSGSGDEAPARISESRTQKTRHWQDADGNDQSSTVVEETQNASRTRDATPEESASMLGAVGSGSGSGPETSNITGAGSPPSSSDVYYGASGDHSSGSIRAARPGISGEVLEDDAAPGNTPDNVQPKNAPGGMRVAKIIPAQVGESGGAPPRHPDAGYDDDDSAIRWDGQRYRWQT